MQYKSYHTALPHIIVSELLQPQNPYAIQQLELSPSYCSVDGAGSPLLPLHSAIQKLEYPLCIVYHMETYM